jgi:hypothetical protein
VSVSCGQQVASELRVRVVVVHERRDPLQVATQATEPPSTLPERPVDGEKGSRRADGNLPGTRRLQLQDDVSQKAARRRDRVIARVVVDDEEPAGLHIARERSHRVLGHGRMLNHAEAEHHIERASGDRQRTDVGLTDEVVLLVATVRVVRVHGRRQIRGHDTCSRGEQDLREPAGATARFEHRPAVDDVNGAAQTARQSIT